GARPTPARAAADEGRVHRPDRLLLLSPGCGHPPSGVGHGARSRAPAVRAQRLARGDRQHRPHARHRLVRVRERRPRAMSLRTPLRRVLGTGSAKGGVHHWWQQRLTSVALVPLGVWFAVSILALPALDHATVAVWMHESTTALLLILLVLVA